MKHRLVYILLIVLIAFSSCVKDITVELPQADPCLVVDGYIDLDDYPIVFLSKSMTYFQDLDTNFVQDLQITDKHAVVVVSDGNISDTLQYLPIQRWPYKCFQGTKFKGQINHRYDLTVIYDGNTYYSTTSIPDTVPINEVKPQFLTDTLALMQIKWRDPAGISNYYTIHVKNQDQPMFYRPYMLAHITDDEQSDGKDMSFSMIMKGLERNDYYNDFYTDEDSIYNHLDDLLCFKIGDTVSMKLSCIDNVSYNVWSSWYRNWITDGNPFTNPATVKTNIAGQTTVRGFWMGYACNIRSVYIVEKDSIIPVNNF